ncbi:zinc-binding dehydrogenase [Anoxynatronum sibiricum]|uniref:Zinc-binding dehydrogenase n=1 Tax=Anoxynatronum sibiricum TaxID=210623 RepID=A0ABU9VPV1_9CLOT
MKAMIIREFGGPEKFQMAEIAEPKPKANQVLIRVKTSSVNPIDMKIRSGLVPAAAPPFPAVLNVDVAGVVVEVGAAVDGFSPGDRVVALGGGVKGHHGALAEYTCIDAPLLAKIPDEVSDAAAAALPVAGLTAWEALVNRGQVKADDLVLIHGGAGGVGHMAVQLAAALGTEVATTVSGDEKAALAKKLGARHVIDYRKETVEAYVQAYTHQKGFRFVLDTVGGENLDRSFQAAALKGTVVATNTRSTHNLALMHGKGLTLHVVFLLVPLLFGLEKEQVGSDLKKLLAMTAEGRLAPALHQQSFGFSDIKGAHELLEQGGYLGKISLVNDL